MLDTIEQRRAFFALGGMSGWRSMRDALTRTRKVRKDSELKAAAVRRRMANLDKVAARWRHETRDLASVAGDVAARIDSDCARLPDRLRVRYVETWLAATLAEGDLRLVRAVVSRVSGSVLGFDDADGVRLSGRARRAAFDTYASMLGAADGIAYRGRGVAVATGNVTMGAVVYADVREARPRDAAPHNVARPKIGTVADVQAERERRAAFASNLERYTRARKETTQGLSAPALRGDDLPEIAPSTGDGASATLQG